MCTGGLQGDFIRHSDQILGQECTGCIEVVAEVEKEEETSRRDDDRLSSGAQRILVFASFGLEYLDLGPGGEWEVGKRPGWWGWHCALQRTCATFLCAPGNCVLGMDTILHSLSRTTYLKKRWTGATPSGTHSTHWMLLEACLAPVSFSGHRDKGVSPAPYSVGKKNPSMVWVPN